MQEFITSAAIFTCSRFETDHSVEDKKKTLLSSIKGLKKSKENILIFWTPTKFPDVPGVEGHR